MISTVSSLSPYVFLCGESWGRCPKTYQRHHSILASPFSQKPDEPKIDPSIFYPASVETSKRSGCRGISLLGLDLGVLRFLWARTIVVEGLIAPSLLSKADISQIFIVRIGGLILGRPE